MRVKTRKKFLTIIVCICSLFAIRISAFGAQQQKLIQSVWVEGETLKVICAGVEDGEGEYTASLGGQELLVTATDIREEKIPVTVLCLVDISGSISEYKMTLLQDTLKTISANMSEGDSMVLATIDDQLNVGEAMFTAEERLAAIESITSSHKDTNLYAGIVNSLDRLNSDESYSPYRCLVVISDGVDCQDNGMTEEEAISAIERSHLPVYTVAVMTKADELEGGKILGSFARSSFGGAHFTTAAEGAGKPLRTDVSGEEFGSNIWTLLQGMTVLKAELSETEIDHSKDTTALAVSLSSGSSVYTDSMEIDTSELPVHSEDTEQQEESSEALPTETEQASGMSSESDGNGRLWILLLGIAAAAAIVVTVLIIVKKRVKKQEENENGEEAVGEIKTEPAVSDIPPQKSAAVDENYHPESTYLVQMTDIPHGAHRLSFVIPAYQAVTFGRDKRAVNILDVKDNQLSGVHFSIIAQDKIYCIRDENSTNGTFVNGVPIAGKSWNKLASGDKVRVGSYEYRIMITPSEPK